MTQEQKEKWEAFISSFNPHKFKSDELKPIFELHAEIYNHKYYEPCTCNGREIKSWIHQLKTLYDK